MASPVSRDSLTPYANIALLTTGKVGQFRVLIVEPFVALLLSFMAMWLMRYVDARFSWLLALSSTIMAATFYLQSFFIVRELWSRSPAVA